MISYIFIGLVIVLCVYAIMILVKSESSAREHEMNREVKLKELGEENQKLDTALRQERLQREVYENLQQECERLKREQQDRIDQMKQKDDSLNEHEKKLQNLREESEQKLKETYDVLEELRAQRLAAQQQEEERMARTKGEADRIIDELKKDRDALTEKKIQLEQESAQLRELNHQFSEREKIVHYDLIRSRAQALGLEKMCEDFKIQIEQMERSLEKNNQGETV